MCSPKVLRERHGKNVPECMYYRAWAWLYDNEWRLAGRDAAVLELAGVTKQLPAGRPFYWERVADPNSDRSLFEQREIVHFATAAPQWAITLARKLMDDQALVKRFGRFRLEDRQFTRSEAQQQAALGVPKGKKMVIPMEMRAKIIRIAADNAMTREFAADDLDAVLTIIRDSL